MVMGLALLPESLIGLDMTITRKKAATSSKWEFTTEHEHFCYQSHISDPSIMIITPPSGFPVDTLFNVTSTPTSTIVSSGSIGTTSASGSSGSIGATSTSVSPGQGVSTIPVGPEVQVYKVVCILFKSLSLIGCMTTVFLVQLWENKYGVLKDSWITMDTSGKCQSELLTTLATLESHKVAKVVWVTQLWKVRYKNF